MSGLRACADPVHPVARRSAAKVARVARDALDTHVEAADEDLPVMLAALERALNVVAEPSRHRRLSSVLELLRAWDRSSRADSVARPSVAVAGVPAQDGAAFTFDTRAAPGVPGFGVHGATYVAVVEFGSHVRARSVHVFGTSTVPTSPHYQDQSSLYAAGRLKPAWFSRADVLAHARRSYHPGEEH